MCGEIGCKICEYSLKLKYIYNKDFFLPVSSFSSCSSISFIYFIFCTKCHAYYIGESKRSVKKRIAEHLYNIKKFKAYKKNYTSVSAHFNLKGHSCDNFKFFVLDSDLDHYDRLHLEKKLIHLLKLFNFKLINWDFPSYYTNIYCIGVS